MKPKFPIDGERGRLARRFRRPAETVPIGETPMAATGTVPLPQTLNDDQGTRNKD